MCKSQPIKIALMVLGLLLLGALILIVSGDKGIGGISFDNPQYNTATNTVITCSGATSTVLLAENVGRNSFELTASSTDVTICKSAVGCVFASGLIIEADEFYRQDDGYTGAYSCIGPGVTSTLGIIHG